MANQPVDPRITEEFKKRRKRQIIATIPFIIGLLFILVLGSTSVSGVIPGAAFLIYVIGMILFSFKNWKCPGCNKYLGKGMNPRFCQKCGIQLQV